MTTDKPDHEAATKAAREVLRKWDSEGEMTNLARCYLALQQTVDAVAGEMRAMQLDDCGECQWEHMEDAVWAAHAWADRLTEGGE